MESFLVPSMIPSVQQFRQNDEWHLYGSREDEIRRKIMKLKKEGKIKKSASRINDNATETSSPLSSVDNLRRQRENMANNAVMDQYRDKISKKLGKKEKLFPKFANQNRSDDDNVSSTPSSELDNLEFDDLNEEDLDDDEMEMLQAVERALEAKRKREIETESNIRVVDEMEELANQMEMEQKLKLDQMRRNTLGVGGEEKIENSDVEKTTSGVGGSWNKDETSQVDIYRPANGGWGYFPRPKDISKAYGGGRKIGADVQTTYEDELRKQRAVEETREKLRRYREKVGIEVQSEKDHAKEIEEALLIGQRAMQRGVYGAAVSALEKVTKWCSTNSKVGGQVFLELAMAYEAVGRTSEAIQVYTVLSTSRMEGIKYNAKRLLYGIEAMQFMRDEAKSEAFSRKRVSQTFIDTTGLGNIAENFDVRYNTAYVDLDRKGGYYRKLTENVVRSIREARQILLAATDSTEVERTKVVQALRSIDRSFSDSLDEEMKRNEPEPEPVAIMNGVPIISSSKEEKKPGIPGLDSFNLGDMSQIIENIEGPWKLQLIADSKGDGVSFFNKTLAWQNFSIEDMRYKAAGPYGFLSLSQSGSFSIDEELRIITRKEVEKEGSAAFFLDVYSGDLSGPIAAINLQQQIISVDSELLVTRKVVSKDKLADTVKGYFSVWRRVQGSLLE